MIVKHGTKRDFAQRPYMSLQLFQAMLIGFLGSALYVAVDKLEPDRPLGLQGGEGQRNRAKLGHHFGQ
jgi:hypothetical protein